MTIAVGGILNSKSTNQPKYIPQLKIFGKKSHVQVLFEFSIPVSCNLMECYQYNFGIIMIFLVWLVRYFPANDLTIVQ